MLTYEMKAYLLEKVAMTRHMKEVLRRGPRNAAEKAMLLKHQSGQKAGKNIARGNADTAIRQINKGKRAAGQPELSLGERIGVRQRAGQIPSNRSLALGAAGALAGGAGLYAGGKALARRAANARRRRMLAGAGLAAGGAAGGAGLLAALKD